MFGRVRVILVGSGGFLGPPLLGPGVFQEGPRRAAGWLKVFAKELRKNQHFYERNAFWSVWVALWEPLLKALRRRTRPQNTSDICVQSFQAMEAPAGVRKTGPKY